MMRFRRVRSLKQGNENEYEICGMISVRIRNKSKS